MSPFNLFPFERKLFKYFICMYIPGMYLVLLGVEEAIRSPDNGVKAVLRVEEIVLLGTDLSVQSPQLLS